ncbi:MAG: amino acid adenylation domain-containing protein [Lachnospiraceae bacterium]|nr:amino acid adenylation domain-containing protein [Lachnospiraceae bacterium]
MLDFYGSVFSLYLSLINRQEGFLLNTSIPAEDAGLSYKKTLLKISVNPHDSFYDLLRAFQTTYREASEHTIVDVDQYLKRKASYYSVYDYSVSNENSGAVNDDENAMTLIILESELELRYNTGLFSDIYISHMVKNLESLTDRVLSDPEQSIADIDILSQEEKDCLAVFCRGESIEVDRDRMFAESFRSFAAANPDALAVDDGVSKISYGELERTSNSVAYDLLNNHKIARGSRVALMLPRNYHFPELVLALNKIGAAYVPIDMQFPSARIRHMLDIAQAEHLITVRSVSESLDLGVKIICLEDLKFDNDAQVEIKSRKEDLFAILFTSGTSGIPKGVMFYNRQFPWAAAAVKEAFHASCGDCMGSFFSFSFVASYVVCAALYMGCSLRLFNEEEQKNSLLMVKALKENHLNSLILPPNVGIPIYESEELNLDYLVLAGAKLNELSKKERHTKLVNFYGTTEVIVAISKIYDLKNSKDDRVPLGKPVANTWAYILDENNHRMPVGVPGEICISGGLCTPGYCNDSELTAESFVENPYSDCEVNRIMYRTGDIGYYNFDGEIEIIGREDNQLSVRGFRIESDEIISVMKGFAEISDVCLDVENDTLIAYYVASDEANADRTASQTVDRIKEALEKELPFYMIPSLFVRLDKIPLNINGKIDKFGLKRAVAHENIEIADETLRIVVDAFREVLKAEVVLPDDSFVALGGNSLSAMKLQLLLHDKLKISLSSNEFIGLSTPVEIADYIKNNINARPVIDESRYSFVAPCPLSESQLNIYLDESVHDRGTAYNNPFTLTFGDKESASIDEIKAALKKLFEVYPVLKARVMSTEGELSLFFDAEPVIEEGSVDEIGSFVTPFATDESLCRFLLVRDGESTVLCADFHHLIFDGVSLSVFLNSLFSVLRGEEIDYTDKGLLRELSFEETVRSSGMSEAEAFYDRMLADRDEVYELLPSVSVDGGVDGYEYIKSFDMDTEQLDSFLKQHSVTRNQFFAGVFAYTLSRFSGSEKVLFNLLEDGRGHMDLSHSVGMYVKTLPILIDCRNRNIDDFLSYTSELVNSIMKYDLVPFRSMASKYELNADILFQYAHTMYIEAVNRDEMQIELEALKHDLDAELSVYVFENADDGMILRIQASARYSKDFVRRFAEAYERILREMLEAEQLKDIRFTKAEDLECLNDWCRTEKQLPYGDILDAFNSNLSEYGGNKLVEFEDVSYTFAEGAFIADKVRRKLLLLGVTKQDRVGFLVPRSELYMFCILGIMSAGAVYVPLDNTLPDERISFMLKDTESRVLIVSDDTLARAEKLDTGKNDFKAPVILNISDIMRGRIGTLVSLPVSEGEIACILYTSGSAGIPKGVRITRKALLSFIDFQVTDLKLRPGDVYGLYASIGFDVSMGAVFSVLYSGACLDVIPESKKRDIRALNRHFEEHHVTHTHITTQIAKLFIREIKESSLKVLVTGGEKLGQIEGHGNYKITDTYGPTEACVYVTSIDLEEKIDSSSVGYLLSNMKAYVLDREQRRVPVGAVGELYLAGPQLADGYLNREDETARAFLTNPFEDNKEYGTFYATGDVARFLTDGTLDIIGRRDGQVKIRGNRVELSEVEAWIRKIDGVRDTTAQIRKHGSNNELVAYVVSDNPDNETAAKRVSDYLSGRVPDYMVPSFVVRLDSIPLNVNGKVDRRALPEVDSELLRAKYVAPRNELEERVVREFEKVFESDRIGINDDFIRLGGDSLTAVRLVSILGNTGITVGDILRFRTPAAIAEYLKACTDISSADLEKYSFDAPCPLLESQLNVYLDESVHDKGTAYHVPYAIRIKEDYSPDDVRNALRKLFIFYPVLKGRVQNTEDSLSLIFDAEPEIREGSVEEIGFFVAPFETDRSLSRFMIARDGNDTVLCVDFHHLIFDGGSMNVFLDSLRSVLMGEDIDFVDKGMLREAALEELLRSEGMEAAEAFYNRMLADREEVYPLLPSVDGAGESFEYIHTFDLKKKELDSFLRKRSVTRNQFFTSVFAYTLSRFSGLEKVLFNLIEDGRGHMDLSRSVGMYVKTLPVLIDCKNRDTDTFLSETSELMNSIMKYDLVPFRTLASKYELNADILFQYAHAMYMDAVNMDKLQMELEMLKHDLDADLSVYVFENADDGLSLRIRSSARYSQDFVRHFAQVYERILRDMMRAEQLKDIHFTTEEDLERLNELNKTDADIPYVDILDAFNVNLARYPGNRLVEYDDASYTFEEGAFIANQVRQKLLASGVRAEDRVGFLVPRSELYMFCVLGIMSAGASYVPMDDKLPDERIAFMLKDTEARVLIVSDDTLERAEKLDTDTRKLLNISDIMKEEIGTLASLPVTVGDTACILYTSGSTGIPKGVKITRDSLRYFIDFHVKDLDIRPGDVYGLYASIGFDVSMAAMFSVIYTGACMNVIPNCKKLDIRALAEHITTHHITHSYITTQIAKLLISQAEDTSLKVLVAGGEKLGQIRDIRRYRIVDAYGPTEACVYVISADTRNKIDSSSVGYVQSNVKAYILDSELRRVPIGAVGGLYLSGPQLADGYLNRPEETDRAFIRNPFEDSERYGSLYYTGDVARILPDGTYGIVGRRDSQVKIRGNRVELSEVEAVIRKMDIVKDVTVKTFSVGGNNELTAYIVSDETDSKVLKDKVSDYLSGRVPDYMVPSFVIRMDSIPLSINGKVDKRALPEVDFNLLHAEYVAPRNELEERIVREFERVFELDRVGINDDFVSLGGDSLTAVRLLAGLRDSGITIADILSLRTPAAIAAGAELLPDLDLYSIENGCPLSNSQTMFYHIAEKKPKKDASLIPSVISVDKKYTDEQIIQALDVVFTAHPVLTMHVEKRDDGPYLVKGSKPVVTKGVFSMVNVFTHMTSDFSIYKSLARFVIVRTPGKCYLVSVFHHVIFDLFSHIVFRRVFYDALEGIVPDHVDTEFLKVPALQQQVRNGKDFERIEKEARGLLSNLKDVGFYINPGKKGKAGFIMRDIDVKPEKVKQFADKVGIDKTVLVTAVMAATLSKLSEREDVFFGFIENGRDRLKSFDSIGLFINAIPLVAHVNHQDMGDFLKKLSEQYYNIARDSHYPFVPLALEYNVSPVILFQFFPDWIADEGDYAQLSVKEWMLNMALSTLKDLVVEALTEVVEGKDGYTLRIYHSGYYSGKMMKLLADTYQETLVEMINYDWGVTE